MAGPITRVVVPASMGAANAPVFGTGTPRRHASVLNRPLSDWNGTAASSDTPVAGGVSGPALVVGEGFFISPRAAALFVERAQEAGGRTARRLSTSAEGPHARCDPLSRWPRIPTAAGDGEGSDIVWDGAYIPAGQTVQQVDAAWWQSLSPLSISPRVMSRKVALSTDARATGNRGLDFTWSNAPLGPAHHWVELLRTNLIALYGAPRSARAGSPLMRYAQAVVRSRRLWGPRTLAAMNTIGPGARIHPTAVVEGCDIGAGAVVGPHAVVRGSLLGDGAQVGAHAICDLSIVGPGAEVQRRAMVVMTLVGAGARSGGTFQLGVLGAGATTKMYAVGTDMRLSGPVKVQSEDGLVPVDMGYQGVCIGENAFVGSGVWIAPGRVIGANAVVGRSRDAMVFDVDPAEEA